MRGRSRRWQTYVAVMATLCTASLGCVTTGVEDLDGAVDTCEQVCGAVVGCVILAPCLVAGTAGFVMGACTRCSEGEDPVDDMGVEETAAHAELPPSPQLAGAGMRY